MPVANENFIKGCGKSKHDDVVTGNTVVTQGKSEKSVYLTPRQEAGKESVFFNDKFEKVDESVEESTTTTGETKIEAGVSEKIKEENLMEETAAEKEKAKDIETEVLSLSAPATANAEKKNLQNDEKVF
ncbi:hypothetical protein QYF36_010292 [Acer negundo]|nr:hypothetical protein QYF36_009261 [Acer negundo]KAK4855730.1 hypothetical protein QYF36_010292 [Acer negundo]